MHRNSAVVLLFGFLSIGALPSFAQQFADTYELVPAVEPLSTEDVIRNNDTNRGTTIDWQNTARQSFHFLGIEHGSRMLQVKTRRQLKGPFFEDWSESVAGVQGWGDGDPVFTNYVAHPMQGAVAGLIQIQNDSHGRSADFSRSRTYWNSRLRAMGWAALYSTQFELGPISEASIGNVGKTKGTAGYVDLVVTPIGGFGLIVLEDAMDKYLVTKWERRTGNLTARRIIRIALNPSRAMANVLRGKFPWYRDSRPISGS